MRSMPMHQVPRTRGCYRSELHSRNLPGYGSGKSIMKTLILPRLDRSQQTVMAAEAGQHRCQPRDVDGAVLW